jgi:hypothetical protein
MSESKLTDIGFLEERIPQKMVIIYLTVHENENAPE